MRMRIMIRRKTPKAKIVLPEKLDASQLTQLFEQVSALRGKPLVLDAGSLRYVGAQGIQILLSAAKTWKRDGVALRLTSATEEFREIVSVLGIDSSDLATEEISP